MLRIPVGERDAIARLDIVNYVSGLDKQNLWDTLVEDGSILPRRSNESFISPPNSMLRGQPSEPESAP